ncbi:asialoglycoprotein receptor 2-like [Asterias rubens]|uniref:asialoglycoprotein receptor 2-like n=1 Tax=Asterias rubens TaxID=7604 RepID=UPI0014551209|nr:asialoglycoprotein receptor 2-like [Asterias rubens]
MDLTGILLLLFGCYTAMTAICPTDWQRYGESCYLLMIQRMNWTEANDTCVNSNAALAVPNSKTEHTFIWSMFLEFINGSESAKHLWIGCYFNQEARGWQNCPMRNESNTYENWKRNNPEHDEPATDCVAMNWKHNGQWVDNQCAWKYFSVCELQVDTTPHSFCLQTGTDGRIKSQCLVGHVMKELRADGVVSCGNACRSEPRCRSFNLLMKQGPGDMVCQLNNATRHEATVVNMMKNENRFYFDP